MQVPGRFTVAVTAEPAAHGSLKDRSVSGCAGLPGGRPGLRTVTETARESTWRKSLRQRGSLVSFVCLLQPGAEWSGPEFSWSWTPELPRPWRPIPDPDS